MTTDNTTAGRIAGELELDELRVRAGVRTIPGGDRFSRADRQPCLAYELKLRGDGFPGPEGVELELLLRAETPDAEPAPFKIGQRFALQLAPMPADELRMGDPEALRAELARTTTTADHQGAIAYGAYVATAGGKSLATGDPLPAWDKLPEPIRRAWGEAAVAVLKDAVRRRP